MYAGKYNHTERRQKGRNNVKRIGFIGMGNMGSAMLLGMLDTFETDELVFTRKNEEEGRKFSEKTGVEYVRSNQELVEKSKYLILAVKPQIFSSVLPEIKKEVTEEKIVISIAAGITIWDIKKDLGEKTRIVRALPNTPALVKEGMSGVCFDESDYTEEEKGTIRRMFESFGKMQIVEERLINAVICASGSSPAYVYLFIEALADSAVKYGLPRQTAYEMAAQTVLGAAKMVLETGEHPGKLKDAVCSPGGTTICGIAALEEYGLRNCIWKASDACYEQAENMSKNK